MATMITMITMAVMNLADIILDIVDFGLGLFAPLILVRAAGIGHYVLRDIGNGDMTNMVTL